jgi:branched-chain amino acid transport system permease protein
MNWGLIFSNAVYVALGASTAAYALIAIGLNVHVGYTGLLNFGQAGFAAVGAYAMAIPISNYDWPWPVAIGFVLVVAILFAFLLGIPTLRLRSDYLAIVTIAAAEILRLFLNSVRFTWLTGGNDGKKGFSRFLIDLNPFGDRRFDFFAQTVSGYQLFMLIIGWSLVAITSVAVFLIMRSPWGRVLKSIREDEDAARSLGKNVFAYKMQSLCIGGFIGALGGLVLAAEKQSAQPSEYGTTLTFFAFTIIILGGLARVKGPIIGAVIFWFVLQFIDNMLEQATRHDKLPDSIVNSNNFSQVKFIVAGLALAALVVFRPQGIFGDKREQAFDVR